MRTAVLGCGSIGRRHLDNLRRLGCNDIVAFEIDPQRAASLAAAGVNVAATLDALWQSQPAAVVVATPSFEHVELAAAATAHGCDLFVEKPLGHSMDGVRDLVAETEHRKLVTLVGCNMRFHPGPRTVKRLIDEGAVGTVIAARLQTGSYLPSWRPGTDYRHGYSAQAAQGGGAILDCIHEIDLALWYLGPASLTAAVVRPASSLGLAVDGLAELLLEHDGGAVSSVHLNFVQRDYRRSCQIVGTTGTIYWDFERPTVDVRRGTGVDETHRLPAEWTVNDMYLDELHHFIDCVEHRRPTTAPLRQGAAALEIALAARARATATAAAAGHEAR